MCFLGGVVTSRECSLSHREHQGAAALGSKVAAVGCGQGCRSGR